ncbi:MAG: hypothetical protein ABI183_06525 [Polyangiaceae bacterium]
MDASIVRHARNCSIAKQAGRPARSELWSRDPAFEGLSIVAESSAVTYAFALERVESPSSTQTSLGPWFSFRQIVGLEKEW